CAAPVDPLAPVTGQVDYEARHAECAGYCRGGRCVAYAALGAACLSSKMCAPGQHCASSRCVDGPPPGVGESCAGTTCAGDALCLGDKCVAPKSAGEACTSPFECRGACLKKDGDASGVCGMKCEGWPPPGYTMPVPPRSADVGPRHP